MKKNYFFFLLLTLSCFSVGAGTNLSEQQKNSTIESFLNQKSALRDIVNNSHNIDFFIPQPKEILTDAVELEKLSQRYNDDAVRVKALLIMGVLNRELKNFNDARKYLNQCYALAYKMDLLDIQGQVYSAYAHVYREQKEYDKALESNFKALKLYERAKSPEGINIAYKDIGGIYYWKSEYLEGISYFKKALPYYEKVKNDRRAAQLSVNIGMSYLIISDFSQSIRYLDYAEKIYKEIESTDGIAWVSNNLGEVYHKAGSSEKALEYYSKALKIYRDRKDYSGQMETLSLLSDIYLQNNQKEKAMQNYNEALTIGKENNLQEMMSRIYFTIASKIYWINNHTVKTLHYLDLAEQSASKSTLAKIWSLKAQIYNKKGNFSEARAYSEKSLMFHQMSKEKEQLKLNFQTLSQINENTGDYKSALQNYKLFKTYDESLKIDDASKTIMKYEFEQKESDLKARQQAELIRKNTISYITYAVLGVVILMVVFVLYIFWIRNKKLQLEKQNLDLKRREAELAKDTEEFKARFLSNISHEFRTPLTLINGHLEILKKDSDKKTAKRYKEMEYSGKRLLQLINQLLDLTKLETGKYTLYYKKGDLLNEVQSYIQAFHSLAEERKIELTTTISFAARTKFTQLDFAYSSEALASLFDNLLSNALKFTPKNGSVHVNIDYLGGKLYVGVRDSGLGIPPEDLTNIFDRFYQVKQHEKPIYEGSGIGLAIVKELAQYHGGDAEVINNPEGGCTFSVWLAEGINVLDTADSGFVYVAPLDHSSTLKEDDGAEKPIVLVVEDQRELRKFIVENLGSDYRYVEAENGKQGVETALECLPEIIISDVMMPEMDGFQLTKSLKSNQITSHIPIILLTAKAEQTDKIEGLENGADDYLTKPFSIAELQLRVKNRLRQQEHLRNKFSDNVASPNAESVSELNVLDRNFIEKLNTFVHQNIENEIDVTLVAGEIGLSNSQLTRKLKVMLGITPANFIRNIRMDAALKLLKNGYSVSETCWKTGFEDPAYFSKVFKKHFGFLPSEKEKL